MMKALTYLGGLICVAEEQQLVTYFTSVVSLLSSAECSLFNQSAEECIFEKGVCA